MVVTDVLWLIIVLPLAGAVVLHFLGRRIGEPLAGWLAAGAMGLSFVVAVVASGEFIRGDELPPLHVPLWEWMPAIGANLELQWDPLASLMTLVVTGVGTLIHVFAIGYMHGDPRFGRFFTYLNLFAASMLTLVLAGNFAMLFMGWELVGLCSYLLISFWYTRPSAAAAGKKAFVVNRIGDLGFMIALMLVFLHFGTLSFEGVFEWAGEVLTPGVATAIGLLFLVGAAGKSAQVPLYVWLPDAMEGPTPVSALIHAATMVTAGVYLVARSAPIFELSETAGLTVAVVGAVTALWAASIALAQTDIKRVLAYSTVSQLGYMFLAVGLGGYVAGVFHLMTHAFFKALLFLGAGSVIHGMHDEQDMRKMGGLRSKMPVTAITMGIATLAIAGIPPLAGFWSKDEILGVAFERSGFGSASEVLVFVLYLAGLITALLTAFYMVRQWVMVFLGRPRWDEGVEPHESPRVMTVPLMVLAGLSVVGGFLNTPFRLTLEHYLEPAFELVKITHPPEDLFWVLAAISVLAGAAGAAIGFITYNQSPEGWKRFEGAFGKLWTAWGDAYNVDDLYGAAIVTPGRKLAEAAAFRFDLPIVDGAVNGVGAAARAIGAFARRAQTGLVRSYGVLFVAGLLAAVVWMVSRVGAV